MKTVALTYMESKTVKLTEWVGTRDGERDGEMGITGFDASEIFEICHTAGLV